MNKATVVILSVLIGFLFLTEGCSSTPGPTSLEPEINILAASGITRNDAILKATVAMRGNGSLSFFRFRYGETEAMDHESTDLSIDADTILFQLSGLKAGTEYYFSAEGGNGAAVITTRVMTFTTMPNVPPTVTDAVALSSGPVGLIVGFGLTSDGGSPVTEAGCDLLNLSTGEKSRYRLEPQSIKIGENRMYISVGTTGQEGMEYLITPFAVNEIGEASGNPITFTSGEAVRLSIPGTLSVLLGDYVATSDSIVIAGKMNGDDFRFLRRMLDAPILPGEVPLKKFISEVDISNADIVAGGSTYDGSRFTSPDTITTGLFADCHALERIFLPISAISIRSDAFSGCSGLRELTIPANIQSVQMSTGCIALEEINVSKANNSFKSHEGILFNRNLTEILWVPQARKGHFQVPPSVEDIKENAFNGTQITSISFESGIKSIGRGAFSNTALVDVTLPDDLANLSESLFQGCRMLTDVHLGKGTGYVGNYVFDGCPLQNLYIGSDYPPFLAAETFGTDASKIFGLCTLHVPEESVSLYRNHREWGRFKNITPFSTLNE